MYYSRKQTSKKLTLTARTILQCIPPQHRVDFVDIWGYFSAGGIEMPARGLYPRKNRKKCFYYKLTAFYSNGSKILPNGLVWLLVISLFQYILRQLHTRIASDSTQNIWVLCCVQHCFTSPQFWENWKFSVSWYEFLFCWQTQLISFFYLFVASRYLSCVNRSAPAIILWSSVTNLLAKSPLTKSQFSKHFKATLILAFSITNNSIWVINWASHSNTRIIIMDNNKNQMQEIHPSGENKKVFKIKGERVS